MIFIWITKQICADLARLYGMLILVIRRINIHCDKLQFRKIKRYRNESMLLMENVIPYIESFSVHWLMRPGHFQWYLFLWVQCDNDSRLIQVIIAWLRLRLRLRLRQILFYINGYKYHIRFTCIWSKIQITVYSWCIIKHRHVRRPPLRSDLTAGMEATRRGKALSKWWAITWTNNALTHLPLDKMAAISQTIFSDVFSCMKSFVFWLFQVYSQGSNWQ